MLPESVWNLLPREFPSDTTSGWARRWAEKSALTQREALAFVWAMHLLSRLDGQALSTALMGVPELNRGLKEYRIEEISAGFIPYVTDSPRSTDFYRSELTSREVSIVESNGIKYAFGIVIGFSTAGPERDIPAYESTSQHIAISGFPVVVEQRIVDTNSPPGLAGAASACFARPLPTKRYFGPHWSCGMVVARHSLANLGFSPGVSVPLAGGGAYPLVDIDESSIDAAILDCGNFPNSSTPIPLALAIAPGMSVAIRSPSGNIAANVLRVNDHPNYYGNLCSHRIFLDAHGKRGDSGSLVHRCSPMEAIGLYMGVTGGSLAEGIVQSLRQVSNFFEVELLD